MSKIKAFRFPPAVADEMIKSILDERKTVMRVHPFQLPDRFSSMQLERMEYRTENTFKSEDYKWKNERKWSAVFGNGTGINYVVSCKYQPEDILYLQETWCKTNCFGLQDGYVYKANNNAILEQTGFVPKWRPSTSMPREAARLFLRVKKVWVERLQDMPGNDFQRDFGFCLEAVQAVGRDALAKPFWVSTLKSADRPHYGWDANPWVEVVEFEKIGKKEAFDDCT